MLNFLRQGIKYFFAIFLFGLVFWANPIEGHCYYTYGRTSSIPNGVTLPYTYSNFLPSDLGTLSPSSYSFYTNFTIPLSNEFPFAPLVSSSYSFDVNFNFLVYNSFYNVNCSGSLLINFSCYYTDSDNVSHVFPCYSSYNDVVLSDDVAFNSINLNFPVSTPGRPDSLVVTILSYTPDIGSTPWVFSVNPDFSGSLTGSSSTNTVTMSGYVSSAAGSFSGSASGTVIEAPNSGTYSGSNGSGTWSEDYYSSQNSGSWQAGNGVNTGLSGNISLPNQSISVTGVFPSSSGGDLLFSEEDIDPSGSYFIFGIGLSCSNLVENYDPKISDTLTSINEQFEDFFDYVAPNTQSFNADKSTTDSMIQSASSIQSGYFDSLSSAVDDTGLDSYDFAEYNPQVNYVSGLLTDVYNTFPNKLKYVIYFVLFLGMFSVLINAVSYVVNKRGK